MLYHYTRNCRLQNMFSGNSSPAVLKVILYQQLKLLLESSITTVKYNLKMVSASLPSVLLHFQLKATVLQILFLFCVFQKS